jgi:hypothetical protein
MKARSSDATGTAGTTGLAGVAGTASYTTGTAEAPFAPGPLRPSARFVPPDHYWGFGGGYSRTTPTGGGAVDENNFLYDGLHHCWRHSGYCGNYGGYYNNSCYGRSYGNCYARSSCYYPSYSRSCWR